MPTIELLVENELLRQRVAELEADGRIACSFEGHTKDVARIVRLKAALREIRDALPPNRGLWHIADKALAQEGGE